MTASPQESALRLDCLRLAVESGRYYLADDRASASGEIVARAQAFYDFAVRGAATAPVAGKAPETAAAGHSRSD
ncbi:MAG TPA: hypothetical protein VMS01_04395 [Stellaceae bacterium]|nr:hypothetical protein [Stellaceae bacterium]